MFSINYQLYLFSSCPAILWRNSVAQTHFSNVVLVCVSAQCSPLIEAFPVFHIIIGCIIKPQVPQEFLQSPVHSISNLNAFALIIQFNNYHSYSLE